MESNTEIQRFVNRLRIMHSLDAHELEGMSESYVRQFLANPFRTMMKLDERNLRIVAKAIQRRENGNKA